MDGADVVVALKQAGEEIWAVGIDDTYSSMSQEAQDDEPVGNAFDITWLTVVCIKLKEMKQGRKPKVRIRVLTGPRADRAAFAPYASSSSAAMRSRSSADSIGLPTTSSTASSS